MTKASTSAIRHGSAQQPACRIAGRGQPRTAREIVAALALPRPHATASRPPCPLPMADLHHLPRDGSMLYGIGRVDASGRVANHAIIEALGWRNGDKLDVVMASRAIVIRQSPVGLFSVPQRPCIVIPATARRQCDIEAGDHVLLAAAPEYGVVIVHTLSALDDMIAGYHSADPHTKTS